MTCSALPWDTVLKALSHNAVVCRGILGIEIVTTGGGPAPEEEFDSFLRECGVVPYDIAASELDVIVIGRDDWDSTEIEHAINCRIGKKLRVYSQEMVLVALAAGQDPFEIFTREQLMTFGNGHPGLEFLMEDMGFDWPTTNVSIHGPSGHGQLQVDWMPETGILKGMGYVVGKNGLPQASRRKVLDTVYKKDMETVPGFNPSYLRDWGSPATAKRLEKMANCIATFSRHRKLRMSGDYSKAIADWESDLEYLKRKYYKKGFSFRWPDVGVL